MEQCLTDNQLLETLTPDPLLESDLLALDENALKTQLSEITLNPNENLEAQIENDLSKEILSKFSSNAAIEFDTNGLRRSTRQQNFSEDIDVDEQLCKLKCVFFCFKFCIQYFCF